MPVYVCKALTPQGRVVRSRIEDTSRLACIRKLKRNGLTPISVSQTISIRSKNRRVNAKTRKNIKPEANLNYKNKNIKNKNKKSKRAVYGKN